MRMKKTEHSAYMEYGECLSPNADKTKHCKRRAPIKKKRNFSTHKCVYKNNVVLSVFFMIWLCLISKARNRLFFQTYVECVATLYLYINPTRAIIARSLKKRRREKQTLSCSNNFMCPDINCKYNLHTLHLHSFRYSRKRQ